MAHRGGAEWGPNLGKENTHHAFAQAVSLGYRYIETDLQVTRDGRLVCFHDDTLDRVTGVPGRVRDFTASELSEITVGGEPIPFFDEVLRTFPEVCFNVDLKTDDAVVPLTKAIHVFGVQDRILVDSFSQTRISRFRALTHGTIPTAMAPVGVAWTAFVPVLSTIISSPAIAIQVPIREKIGPVTIQVISAETIERVHRIGKVIHAWTINDPQEMETLIDWGIDGIITDRPDLLKEILVRRNLWSTNE
ncbi:MAG: glycerophosphodiester phosphodiesterase [Propionibacteriaceae bacterium]|nr:glycerophosphodiester phosphodiesterase [Propionibacteriaceae bacterium]